MMVNILLIDSNTLEKFVPICCIINIFKILSCSSDSSMLWGHAHLYGPYHGLVLSQCLVRRSLIPGFRPPVFGPPIYRQVNSAYIYIYIYIVEKNYFLFLGIHT